MVVKTWKFDSYSLVKYILLHVQWRPGQLEPLTHVNRGTFSCLELFNLYFNAQFTKKRKKTDLSSVVILLATA